MKKTTALLLFLISFIVVTALYVIGNMLYLPVYLVYLAVTTISMCVYLWMFFYHNNEIGIAKMNGKEVSKEVYEKRKLRMKIFIIVFFPFFIVVMCDSLYLLLIKDNPLFAPIFNLFK